MNTCTYKDHLTHCARKEDATTSTMPSKVKDFRLFPPTLLLLLCL